MGPLRALVLAAGAATAAAACGPRAVAVLGPVDDPARVAETARQATGLEGPTRIDFRWRLNEEGSRVSGVGVARVEPPHNARLDLFLDNGETVISAALVGDDLRLPPGAPDDVLPPVELMWATLGVFRPMEGTRLLGGERLEDGASRLRYGLPDGDELRFELTDETVRTLEVVDGSSVVEWVRLEPAPDGRYPESATYRNLVDFRELSITRTEVREQEPFDRAIWDPRG